MNKHCLLIISLLMIGLAGCMPSSRSSSGGSGGESLDQQVYRHDQEIKAMRSQFGQVDQVLPAQAEMWSQTQTMRQEMNQMHGALDDIQRNIASAGNMGQLAERVNRLEIVVRRMAAQLGVDSSALDAPLPEASTPAPYPPSGNSGNYGQPAGPATATPPVAPPPATTPPPPPASAGQGDGVVDTATALYDSGIKAFDERRYNDAMKSFNDFSQNFPQHKLASNALFWEGESYYQVKDYANAAMAYQEVIQKFPGSNKYLSALLKQGMALYFAGKKDAAKVRLDELVANYPKSPEASRAKQFMQTNK